MIWVQTGTAGVPNSMTSRKVIDPSRDGTFTDRQVEIMA